MTDLQEDRYAGLSGLVLTNPELELGHGVVLRQTYAHLFAPFMMAFTPAVGKQPHPGPWKAARGGLAQEITAELFIPASTTERLGTTNAVAQAVVFALRLGVNPATSLAVFSNRPFTPEDQSSDDGAWVMLVDVEPRRFSLAVDYGVPNEAAARWVADRWPTALKFTKESAEFALAADALNVGQYVHRSALTIVSLWASLEALFSPSTSELKFRVSSLIAAYLEPPGERRQARAMAISKLYDKRSSAAHGKPNHETSHVLDSFNLVREVLTKMLDQRHIPSKSELERLLYGASIE